ncbi:hypothetical protein [Pantanalinema sp. GBBB05]|uniref:hypothetical protein n=1 Tax=Pantanalinema sp. GBBB05 TaxID=2604139 RepID=UPI001D7D75F5|nr:hypothetical protein [Pantanalinema sp. GBBB05]
MNTESAIQKTWLSVTLMGIAYVLLGWYLSAYHVVGLLGACILIATLVLVWKHAPMIEFLNWLRHQKLFVVIGISLLTSVIIIILILNPLFLNLFFLPFITVLFADMELRIAGFPERETLLYLVTIAGLSLGCGEAIDLFISPSLRY